MLVVGQGVGLVLRGAVLGLVGAFGVTRLLEGLLFEVTPTDPTTMAVVTIVLVVTAVMASLLPAVRATGIDPMTALRGEQP